MVKFTLFFLSLSLLIILHEFGHFITARMFKTKVKKFYLFFDFLFPFANIAKFSLFKKKVGDTEYGLGWFPFGGYVDIDGMMGETDEVTNEVKAPEPHEFRAKKPWQRLIILAGGVTVNYLLAIIIFSVMMITWGEDYLKPEDAKYGMAVDSLGKAIGFRDGDIPVKLNNQPIKDVDKITAKLVLDDIKTVDVMRDGQTISVEIPADLKRRAIKNETHSLFQERFPFEVREVMADYPASIVGLKPGDKLIAVNGDTMQFYQQFVDMFQRSKGENIKLLVMRQEKPKEFTLRVTDDGAIGVRPVSPEKFLHYTHISYSFFGGWGRGFMKTNETLANYVKQLKLLFTREGASKVGGFASIAGIFPEGWDWEAFWGITALLSVILAFMNLLPIPVLDGGYILFVLWEMVTGKKVSDKFMQRALTIGMYLMLALLVFANGNDIIRAITHK